MKQTNGRNGYWVFVVIALVLVIGLLMLGTEKDDPSTRLGEAVEELGEGLEDAGRELDPNRTTGEKIGDAIEDVGDSVEDATDR